MKNKLFSILLAVVMVFGVLPFASSAAKDDPAVEDPFVGTTAVSPTVAKKINNFKITVNSLTGITLSWNKVENATSYRVYRSDGTGAIKLYSTVSKNSFTDTSLSRGKTYSYQIMAIASVSGVTSRSEYSSVVKYTVLAKKINSVTVSSKSKKATFNVKKVGGATGYEITYSTGKKFKKAKVKTFNSNKFSVKKLKKNKKYYTKIRAFAKINGKTYYTAYLKKNFKTKK